MSTVETLARPPLVMTSTSQFASHRFVRHLLTPGSIPSRVVLITSTLQMFVVFALDILTPPDIRLHVIYIFPMAAITLHCEQPMAIVYGFALSILLQLTTFVVQGISMGPMVTDTLVAAAASALTIFLARGVRENYLETVDLATHDHLTSLHNRRSFEAILSSEVARLDRYGGVFTLAMLDLDNFKALNDARGHHVGDQALQLLADVLGDHSRQTDSIARLGGDEFAILMPNTGEEDSRLRCRQLGATIAEKMTEAGYGITASLGHVSFMTAPESTAHAIRQADDAMYATKRQQMKGTADRLPLP